MQPTPPSSASPRAEAAPAVPQRAPARDTLTDQLFYTWERLRPEQQAAALAMVEQLRATRAAVRRRRLLGLLVLLALVAAAVLVYVVVRLPLATAS